MLATKDDSMVCPYGLSSRSRMMSVTTWLWQPACVPTLTILVSSAWAFLPSFDFCDFAERKTKKTQQHAASYIFHD